MIKYIYILYGIGYPVLYFIGAAANYMAPYTAYTLPQSANLQAAVAAASGILSPYQGPGATLQEARLQ